MKLTLNSGICSILLACSFFSCTNLQEEEAPVTLGVNVDELSYDTGSSLHPVIISSGTKWIVSSIPAWMSLESISSSNGSPYEWTANFAAEANDGYNREGRIVINAKDESAEIAVTQEGKKGEYVAVESVSISPSILTLTEGESSTLTYTINPSNASEKGVTWKSSSPSVATVSESGEVEAIAVGTTMITITTEDGGKTSSCAATVKAKVIPVESVSLDKTSITMTVGDTKTLIATVTPDNATDKSVAWSSSNTSVATVSSYGVVTAKTAGTATITVTTVDGYKKAECALTVKSKDIPVESISLDRTGLVMKLGESRTLTATVSPTSATEKGVTWTSDNSSVATVSTSGVVTAKGYGSATIRAKTIDGGYVADCSVEVYTPIQDLDISMPTEFTITEGEIDFLYVSINVDIEGTHIDPLLEHYSHWSVEDESIVSIQEQATSCFNVCLKALSVGTTKVTNKLRDSFGSRSLSCIVTVEKKTVPVSGVSLDKTDITMTVGDTQILTTTITPDNATDKSVTWSSSNTSVAAVSSSGVVTAKASGTATITAMTTDGSKKASCSVTVQAAKVSVTGVSLNKSSLSMTVGDTERLTATVAPTNATNKNVTWSSSNSSVATVDSNGNVSAVKVGTTVITATTEDGGKTATCSVTVNPIAVTGVSLNQTSLTMTVGETQPLSATVTPSNATDKSVIWSSSNTSVATVSSSGVVTAYSAGIATITVTTNDGSKKATCAVTVKAKTISVTEVSLNKTSLSLLIGGTERLTATVTPSNATNKKVTWSSSNSSIAAVDSNGNVSAIKVGTAVITATTEDGGKTAACSITVNPIAVTGVSLNQSSLTMTVGDTQTLSATVTPSNATDKSVIWSSSNTSVATVSSSGFVSAKEAGTATIMVTTNDGGKKATCSVTVQAAKVSVTGVSLNKSSLAMTVGDTETLTATVTPTNATDKSVYWSSSNTSVAAVSTSGVVTAKAAGTTTITVTTNDGGKKATCSVTVQAKAIAVTGVSLDKTSLSMTEGEAYTLTATVSPANATNKSVTWTSSSNSVATVSPTGVVTAKAAGTATITVTTVEGAKTATCAVTVKATAVAVTGVSLNKSSLSMAEGDTETLTVTITPSNATDKSVFWSSDDTSVANVSSAGVVTAGSAGTTIVTVRTNDGAKTSSCIIVVYPKKTTMSFVDLGLSVKWAVSNIGASSASGFGEYFSWAEIYPKSYYSLSNYSWYDSDTACYTKYNSDDNVRTIQLEDDVANLSLYGGCRIPTSSEWNELRSNCQWQWTKMNGVLGYKITGKKSGYTNNWIFLPAAGAYSGSTRKDVNENGYYWSSFRYDERSAYYVFFWPGPTTPMFQVKNDGSRASGFTIRAVKK